MTELTPDEGAERRRTPERGPAEAGPGGWAAEARPGGGEYGEGAEAQPGSGAYRGAGEALPGEGGPGGAAAHREGGGSPTGGGGREPRLLPREECDSFEVRLRHALGEFVDDPREAVEEADRVVQEVASRLAEAVASRRRTLKASWQETGDDPHPTADTEQLRLALRDYRATAERLLSM